MKSLNTRFGARRSSTLGSILGLSLLVVAVGACSDDAPTFEIVQFEVTVTCLNDGGTYAGQTFTATFQIDVGSLTGTGSETIDAALDNFSFDFPRGASSGSDLGTAYFEDGTLTKIVFVSGGAYGFNGGFNSGQVPDSIEAGLWFGYLTPGTAVDGFGTYTITRL